MVSGIARVRRYFQRREEADNQLSAIIAEQNSVINRPNHERPLATALVKLLRKGIKRH